MIVFGLVVWANSCIVAVSFWQQSNVHPDQIVRPKLGVFFNITILC